MNMGQAISVCFRKYATFSGRARRVEYWYFILFIFLIAALAAIADAAWGIDENFSLFSTIWNLSVFIPSLAAGFRRLHDTNKSGWWIFLPYPLMSILLWMTNFSFIFVIAFLTISSATLILLTLWLAWPGDIGENRFGPDPLRPDLAEDISGRA